MRTALSPPNRSKRRLSSASFRSGFRSVFGKLTSPPIPLSTLWRGGMFFMNQKISRDAHVIQVLKRHGERDRRGHELKILRSEVFHVAYTFAGGRPLNLLQMPVYQRHWRGPEIDPRVPP